MLPLAAGSSVLVLWLGVHAYLGHLESTEARFAGPPAALAVVPFEVEGLDPAFWGDGLAILLALDLDGVAGLRALDDRTVRARWEEASSPGVPGEEERLRRFARSSGARVVLRGRVERTEGGVRIEVVGHDEKARVLGRVVVEGDLRTLAVTTDRLAVETAAIVPGAGATPAVSRLDRVASGSTAALALFLGGEAAYARNDFAAAARDFERSVETDPAFALARLRLADAAAWIQDGSDRSRAAAEGAARRMDRLPRRDRDLARARLALGRGRLDGLDLLRQAVRHQPDDPDAWALLAETIYSVGLPAADLDPAELDHALDRVDALAPGFAPAHLRRFDLALAAGDRPRAATALASLVEVAPGGGFTLDRRWRFEVVFGAPAARERALAELASRPDRAVAAAREALGRPATLELSADLLARARRATDDPEATVALAWTRAHQGRIEEALAVVASAPPAPWRLATLLQMRSRGYPVPAEALDGAAAGGDGAEDPVSLFFVAAWGVEAGRSDAVSSALSRLRRGARGAALRGDSLQARTAAAAVSSLEGLVRWRSGDLEEAIRRLEGALHDTYADGDRRLLNEQVRWWLGRIHEEMGNPYQAIDFYGSFPEDPEARARTARSRARVGDLAGARVDYATCLAARTAPDPTLVGRTDEVRRRLAALPATDDR